jgi:ectoine hydroxylase-related dioxygenase (phytanoyl-CoA dioxygenase family)
MERQNLKTTKGANRGSLNRLKVFGWFALCKFDSDNDVVEVNPKSHKGAERRSDPALPNTKE